jgi:hypothetical protein
MINHMEMIDAKQRACLEGLMSECARADDLARTATGMRLLEAQRTLDNCDESEIPAARHWYNAAWDAYALSRGWILKTEQRTATPDYRRRAA